MNYNNEDILHLIKRAREGGETEYSDLMRNVYMTLVQLCKFDTETRRQVKYHYESFEEAVSDNIVYIMDKLVNHFDESRGKLPMTYAVDGFKFSVYKKFSQAHERTKQKKYPRFEASKVDLYDKPDWFDELNDSEDREHKLHVVMKAIRTLPLKQQDALEGHIAGQKLRETAEVMGISHERVRQLKVEAVKAIRQILAKELY